MKGRKVRGLQFLVATWLTNESRRRERGDPRAGICEGYDESVVDRLRGR